MKHYKSKKAFEKAAAFVHIHHVPHHPQRTVEIAGRPYHPMHRGEKVGSCVHCGSHHHSSRHHSDGLEVGIGAEHPSFHGAKAGYHNERKGHHMDIDKVLGSKHIDIGMDEKDFEL